MSSCVSIRLTAVVAAFLLAAPTLASSLDVPADKARIASILDSHYSHLDALYKDIHAHPELAFEENRTAARLAQEMRALGFMVTEHVGKTGLVAILKNGPGPLVLVRTELDALPMEEETGLPYASHVKTTWKGSETSVAHSCGHDIHMAAWVGTATALVALKNSWHGTLMFIAQPAEEAVEGAKAMLDDGLFQRFGKPDYGFALHVGPGPDNEVFYRPGILTSNSDSLDITFKGRGGHGSMPNVTIDPIMMAARFVVDVQSVISREKDPAAFGVITIGSIQAGSAGNIIPDHAVLRGTIRTYDNQVLARMLDGVRRTAKAVADMAGAPPPDVVIVPGGKAVVNDTALTERTAVVFKAAFGKDAVFMPKPITASEDYSEFILAGVPSLFFTVGAFDPKIVAAAQREGKTLPTNHSPLFAPVPEPTIRTAVEAMTLAVMNVTQAP